jgi:dihydroorotate dehydrogenase (NAD+) catalytic subunit
MVKLSLNIANVVFKNPVMTASGTFGNGKEFSDFFDISKLGAIVAKTITYEKRKGNKSPRVAEASSGMLNSIGLENDGIFHFIKHKLPYLKKLKTKAIVSISANSPKEFADMAKLLKKTECVDALEINLSCPNALHNTKRMISQCETAVFETVSTIRKAIKLPLIAKLTPNVTDIALIAKSAEKAGASAIALINSFPAMGVDIKTKKPLLGNIVGGLSGPAIKPIALKMVWDVYNNIKIPIIGIGGIMSGEDAIEFILCGASAVQVGTANFINPKASLEVLQGIEKYCKQNKIKDLSQIRGKLAI